jgi:hypothetical protein
VGWLCLKLYGWAKGMYGWIVYHGWNKCTKCICIPRVLHGKGVLIYLSYIRYMKVEGIIRNRKYRLSP